MHLIINNFISIRQLLIASLVISLETLGTLSTKYDDTHNGQQPRLGLLQLSYFQVESRAMLFGRESITMDAEVRTFERYSNEHARARLKFQSQEFTTSKGREQRGKWPYTQQIEYIFSANSGVLMRISKEPGSARLGCHLSQESALATDLFGLNLDTGQVNDSRAPELAHWERLLSGPKMPSHVVGFARLLLFVELNMDAFKRVERALSCSMRNTQVNQFQFTFELLEMGQRENGTTTTTERWVAAPTHEVKQEVTIVIYLSEKKIASEGCGVGSALRVWLKLPSGAELIVEYTGVGPMRSVDSTSNISPGRAGGGDNLISSFNLPLGQGCSQQVGRVSSPKEPTREIKREVFSFEAHVSDVWFRDRPLQLGHLFVAYDAHAQATRVDSQRAIDSSEPKTISTTIWDFVLGRKYHLISGGDFDQQQQESTRNSNVSSDLMSAVSIKNTGSGGRRCLVTRIREIEQVDMQEAKSIIPWNLLVDMGYALVRGIETRVYEMVSSNLPKFLFQQVAYLDSAGTDHLAHSFKMSTMTKEARASVNFSIVYFVAQSTNCEQLIQIDVYQRDVLLYRADVFNFQWHLADAPNGQPQDELFSLGDTIECSMPHSTLHYEQGDNSILLRPAARMQLELSYMQNAQAFSVPLPREDILQQLTSGPARHKALIRSLGGYPSNSLFSSQMRDLKTSINCDKKRNSQVTGGAANKTFTCQMVVDIELAGLARIEDVALTAVAVGTALLSGNQSNKLSVESVTLEQCFWEAASLFASKQAEVDRTAVLFSFCSSNCWIDSRATIKQRSLQDKSAPLEYQSDVFIISQVDYRTLPCMLLRIERDTKLMKPDESALVRSWLDVQLNLQNKMLSLVFIDEQQQQQAQSKHLNLLFKVTKVSITTTTMTTTSLDEEPDDDQGRRRPSLVDGVCLPPQVGLVETIRVDALDQAQEICHAHCLAAHLTCRSFSLYREFQQQHADCVISSLEFDMGELRNLVSQYYQLAKESHERKLNQITLNVVRVQPNNATGGPIEGIKISLKVNRRCQLSSINANEMFVSDSKLEAHESISRTIWQRHLLPVNNSSECAQICLSKNVNFFKQLTNLTSIDDDSEERFAWLRNQFKYAMRLWCHGFYYLNTKVEPISYELMGKLNQMWLDNGTPHKTPGGRIAGLCYLRRPEWAPPSDLAKVNERQEIKTSSASGKDKQHLELVRLPFKEHQFRYSLLYERQPGFRLARTDANNIEATPPPPGGVMITNDQTIETHPRNIEFCARRCFSQAAHWCRSFDVIHFTRASSTSSLSCIYNSISLRDARRGQGENSTLFLKQQISLAQKSHLVSYDHYEPHEAYALKLNVAASYLNEQELENVKQENDNDTDVHLTPRILLNFIVCILVGSALALLLMRHVYPRDHRRRHARSHMDVRRLSREFICMEE